MQFALGFLLGGLSIFGVAVFAIKWLEKFYKGQIGYYKEEIERLNEWIEKESCGEIDPTNTAERVIK